MADSGEDEPSHYCVPGLVDFQNVYLRSHPLVSLLICLLGSVGNTLTLFALTRQHMRSPVTALLTTRVFVNLLANTIYIPCVLGVFIPKLFNTSNWAINFVPVLDMIAVWLTVAIAFWCYIAVVIPHRSRVLCSMNRAIMIILCACVVCPVVCIPMYLTYCVKVFAVAPEEADISQSEEGPALFYAPPTDLGDVDHALLIDIIEWIYGVVLKIVPCILVGVATLKIVATLLRADRRHGNHVYTKVSSNTEAPPTSSTPTNMLIVLFLVFIFYEFTEGVINMANFILGETFVYQSHKMLFEILDLLNLLNRNIVFILFCATSIQFRSIMMFILKTKFLSFYRRFSSDQEAFMNSSKSS